MVVVAAPSVDVVGRHHTSSLDATIQDDNDNAPLSLLDSLGVEEPNYRTVEDSVR
jgi:hypothetical protein